MGVSALGSFLDFNTGAATPVRIDRVREQGGSCFTSKIHFPERLLAPHRPYIEKGTCGEVGTTRESAPEGATDCSSDLSTLSLDKVMKENVTLEKINSLHHNY